MSRRLALFLAFLGLAPSHAVSRATLPIVGSHSPDVAITSMSLTDKGRPDPFANDGRDREVMVSGFFPVTTCQHERLEAYMPPATASFQDDKFAAYGLPNGSFKSLDLQTCSLSANRTSCFSGSLPLVVFSGALGTSRMIYSSMLQSVAAAGYLVVSVDHPYDADIVEFPNGTVITGVDISDAELETALNTRAEDIAFLYRQLKRPSVQKKLFPQHPQSGTDPKTAIIGHSFGGAAAATSMQQLSFVRGGLNIDGTMFGPVLKAGLDRPFMLIGHENKTQETDPSWKAIWPQLKGWKKEIEVKGAAHYGFSDLPLITSVLGFQDKLPSEVELVLGSIEGHRMMDLTITYVTAFLNMVLKSGSERDLVRANGKFHEVIVVA
ncbi:PAF acetylhydrolase family protein [Byssothecium circinans]|uniref:1-alkyl-2-acetylglycerophosphocholine esterase n=1 Tax=Byssothecium circinans TaxID=147558 RepID=A0A6A5TXV5_9PLEO|nr:PAF acetylhydrolase family protein [Byssothecium circinans]